jgi:hypothetical protein
MRAFVASVVTGLMMSIGYAAPSAAGPAQSAIQGKASPTESGVHQVCGWGWGRGRTAGYVEGEAYSPPVYGWGARRAYSPRVYGWGARRAYSPRVYGWGARRAYRPRVYGYTERRAGYGRRGYGPRVYGYSQRRGIGRSGIRESRRIDRRVVRRGGVY